MATPITVPRLGWNMEQGVFVGWLKADGATVRAGERCPVVIEDQIVIRDRVTLSLTFDHRITDGVPAARFLQILNALIENPQGAL